MIQACFEDEKKEKALEVATYPKIISAVIVVVTVIINDGRHLVIFFGGGEGFGCFLKYVISKIRRNYSFLFFLLATLCGMWDLSYLTSNQTHALGVQSLNHWTIKDIPMLP